MSRRRSVLFAIAGAIVAGAAISASAGSAAAAPIDGEVAVFVVPAQGTMSRARRATLLTSMTQAVRGEKPDLVVIDTDLRLARRAGLLPAEDLAAAQAALARGERLLSRGEARQALPDLDRAAKILVRSLSYARKRDLARAQLLIGAANAALGDRRAARKAFEAILVWRPGFVAEGPFASLAADPSWRAAERAVAARGRGVIELDSRPGGALAYVDGEFVGFTPTTAADLAVGTHYVTFKASGYNRTVVAARVKSDRRRKVKVQLEPSPKGAELDRLVDAVAKNLDGSQGQEDARALGQLLAIDRAIFVQVPGLGVADARYRAALVDVRSGRRLSAATATARADQPPSEVLAELVRGLYTKAAPAVPVAKTSPLPAPHRPLPPRDERRFYHRWWFWTGVAVVAAAAVALPFVLTADGSSSADPAAPGGVGDLVWRF